MTPPTPSPTPLSLEQVRQAAEAVLDCTSGRIESLEAITLAEHILATISPDPDGPITEQWLREEWGWEDCHYGHFWVRPDRDGLWWLSWDNGDHVSTWPRGITTRHQFCQLAAALGIERRTQG